MEKAVRLILAVTLAAMIISMAKLTYSTARYVVFEAYEPRYIEVPVIITRETPPVEAASTTSDLPATQ